MLTAAVCERDRCADGNRIMFQEEASVRVSCPIWWYVDTFCAHPRCRNKGDVDKPQAVCAAAAVYVACFFWRRCGAEIEALAFSEMGVQRDPPWIRTALHQQVITTTGFIFGLKA